MARHKTHSATQSPIYFFDKSEPIPCGPHTQNEREREREREGKDPKTLT